MQRLNQHNSLAEGVIDRHEYEEFQNLYTHRKEEVEQQAERMRTEQRGEMKRLQERMEAVCKQKNDVVGLHRAMVVCLLERILIFRDRRVELVYGWQDTFRWQGESVESQKYGGTEVSL